MQQVVGKKKKISDQKDSQKLEKTKE